MAATGLILAHGFDHCVAERLRRGRRGFAHRPPRHQADRLHTSHHQVDHRPAEVGSQPHAAAASRDQRRTVAEEVHRRALLLGRAGEGLDAPSIDHHILSGGQQRDQHGIEHQHVRPTDGSLQTHGRQTQHQPQHQQQQPTPPAAAWWRQPIGQRRPQEFQRPGQRDQRRERHRGHRETGLGEPRLQAPGDQEERNSGRKTRQEHGQQLAVDAHGRRH